MILSPLQEYVAFIFGTKLFRSFTFLQEPPYTQKDRRAKFSAVWRSSNLYASDWKIHDFASPPRDGFTFSIHNYYMSLDK